MCLKNKVLCLLSTMLVLGFACSGSRSNQEEMSDFIVSFGHGGGFVGKEEKVTIDPKGNINRGNEKIAKLSKSEVNQILSNIQVLGLQHMNFSEPGNIYEFIEIQDSGKIIRFAWAPSSPDVPEALRLLYANLNYLIKSKIK
jgi:hypothetical protein